MSRPWTEAEVAMARKAYADGASVATIARLLRRQRKTVARCLGLTTPTLADEIEAARREAPTSPLYRPGERI